MTGTFNLNIDPRHDGPSFRLDILCLILALAVHVPLFFIKMDMKKKAVDSGKQRLMSVDLINPEDLIKKEPPPPPIAPVVKGPSLMDRLKAMVKTAPPPPPPKPVEKVEPPKPLSVPTEIKLEAKPLAPLKVEAPKLQAKEGFKTNADANLVKDARLSLKAGGPALAPLSEKKLGVIQDRGSLKTGKENFKIAQGETLQGIGAGKGIADPSAPHIAIQTGRVASKEGFSAPAQKADKGAFSAGGVGGLGNAPALSLKDQIIARDAQVGQIGGTSRSPIRSSGGEPVATKRDAGSFSGGVAGGVAGGIPGGTIGGTGTRLANSGSGSAVSAPIVHKKKEMFQLTGELKDRARLHQEVPEYPDWAQQKGIEAAVVLEFSVEPTGNVKDNIVVIRTSGYPELDEAAKKALRKWKFVPLTDGENRNEVGRITFNYTLS